ncbi:FAD binding domain protein [Mycena amicta]|nr:FAD binding domain protein [Mycena amicta]
MQSLGRAAVSQCCALLLASSTLSPLISLPSTNGTYQNTLSSYWTAQEAALHPACVLSPTDSSQVSAALGILSGNADCVFAIKSHGHAPASGFANIADGVTIDLSGLDAISLSADHSVVRVGTGASWLQVYQALDQHGVSAAGGRNGQVGVGGLLLGGGISYFAPRVGWACDAVESFQVVLAGGETVVASRTERPDLFRALKGGGNNLGIVTSADLRSFAQGEILAGSLAHNISDRDAVFAAVARMASAKDYDEYASIVLSFSFSPSAKTWTLSEVPVYTKPELRPKVYEELFAVPNTTDTLHITNLSTFANEAAIPQLGFAFYTGTYAAQKETLSAIFDVANETLIGFDEPEGMLLWSLAFEPLPTKFTQWGDKNGGNVLGTRPSDGNAFILLMSATWANPDVNDEAESLAGDLMKNINEEMQKRGLLHKFQYSNYANPSQDPIGSYGAENVKGLKRASQKYDPSGVFQRQAPGGFKLS